MRKKLLWTPYLPHLVGRAVLEIKVPSIMIMLSEKVFHLEMFGAFGAGDTPIFSILC